VPHRSPGGVTNTGIVPLEAGYDRAGMIQPAVMAPPLNWLVSDAVGGVTGRRFLAVHFGSALDALRAQAAQSPWGVASNSSILDEPRLRSMEEMYLPD
jgi:hypothetical protein